MITVLVLVSVLAFSEASTFDTLTANIAVVEFQRETNTSLPRDQVISNNAQQFQDILSQINETLQEEENKKLDLVIFPEGSLVGNTKEFYLGAIEISVGDNPCEEQGNYPDWLASVSCQASTYSTYLITNLVEKENCSDPKSVSCKNDGLYLYNLDVVFDRTGKIVNKYRKYHLFGEKPLDFPTVPQVEVVKTDFGVNFGIFTCFDIIFKSPAEDVVANDTVDGVIYLTNWLSELPFFTALQAQQMFAYAHSKTVFAAGGNLPSASNGGSGVYKGDRGTILSTIVAEGGSKFLLYKSKNGTVAPPEEEKSVDDLAKEMDAFTLRIDDSIPDYEYKLVNTSQTEIQETICHGEDFELCCNFNIKLSSTGETSNAYTYFMVAFSGIRSYPGIGNFGYELCGVIACLNSSISSCGRRFPNYDEVEWPLTFQEIEINAEYEVNENKTQFPNSLLSSIRPIDASKTVWAQNPISVSDKGRTNWSFKTLEKQDRLLTFAIFGRNFAADSLPEEENTGGGAAFLKIGLGLMFSMILALFVVN